MEIIPIQRAEEVSSAFSNDRRRDYDQNQMHVFKGHDGGSREDDAKRE